MQASTGLPWLLRQTGSVVSRDQRPRAAIRHTQCSRISDVQYTCQNASQSLDTLEKRVRGRYQIACERNSAPRSTVPPVE